MTTDTRPVVALTLGDPAGIGPELIARLLSRPGINAKANIVLVGDPWLWRQGQQVAGVEIATAPADTLAGIRRRPDSDMPALLSVDTVTADAVSIGNANAAGGRSVLQVLDQCMSAAVKHDVDAICFAPLNKHAMKLGGLKHEDELHHFAEYLGVSGYFCEFNTMDSLWTSRISSHIPLKDVPLYINKDRIKEATRLIHRSLRANGLSAPRVAVAALNPHGGDGGTCGREEIDIIEPAIRELIAEGLHVEGPYPADTIFLKARDGLVDAVVTMYHDQGQIAIKLLGFSKGVTVQGGMPIPITTPAHGTAYDIAGQGKADDNAIANAFDIACRMGLGYRNGKLSVSR